MATRSFFTAYDGIHGTELWVTDGTAAGTSLILDIYAGSGSSDISGITSLGNGEAVFSAKDAAHGIELWVSNGTAAGTSLLQDINPAGPTYDSSHYSSNPTDFTALGGNEALFVATNQSQGTELWITDGTAGGTSVLKDIRSGSASSNPEFITALSPGYTVFRATDGAHGSELWVTDGTSAGTSLLMDIHPGALGSYLSLFAPIGGGKAMFVANDGTHGYRPWVTNGTSVGTYQLSTTASTTSPDTTAIGGGKALFQAFDGSHGYELWITDGSSAGTSLLKDIHPGIGSSLPQDIIKLATGKALFVADDGTHGQELWISDGTAGGTSLLKDIYPGSTGSYVGGLTSLGNGKALFSATDGTHGNELWVTDGTAAGTSLLTDIDPGSTGSSPSAITAIGGGEALFQANDGTHGVELWISDGTSAGTSLVSDIVSGATGSTPSEFTAVPCFAAGTRIRTPTGEVTVDDLRVGDSVCVMSGDAMPIVWFGHRTVDCARHPAPRMVWPVRVSAGAFGPGQPSRDLLLSPDHAIYTHEVMIPVKCLINGATITQVPMRAITYYHIELEQHDVLLAEGLPTESYLDTGDRSNFANADGVQRLFPDFSTRVWEASGYAPLIVTGPQIEAVRRWLASFIQAAGADSNNRLTRSSVVNVARHARANASAPVPRSASAEAI